MGEMIQNGTVTNGVDETHFPAWFSPMKITAFEAAVGIIGKKFRYGTMFPVFTGQIVAVEG